MTILFIFNESFLRISEWINFINIVPHRMEILVITIIHVIMAFS